MRQKHGQNFLIDNNIVNNIIKAAELNNNDNVLEIGPGKGILTKVITPLVNKLTAVEIDKILFDQLKHYFNFHNATNIELINEDFLKYNLTDGNPFKVISNLPYNVGTAILQQILPTPNWTIAVVMLQKEVIERLAAKPGGKEYGFISIFTQFYADANILFNVSPSCFNPKPEVMSAVIKLTNKNPQTPNENFFPLIKHSFSMRRKTMLNCLSSFIPMSARNNQSNESITKPEAENILRKAGVDPILRPDKLSIDNFLTISNLLP